ncbi:MAG: phosphatase PAP2 family protein [Negativicutes bacterium]
MIKNWLAMLNDRGNFGKAMSMALLIGVINILVVLYMPKSHNPDIYSVAQFLGSPGNDIFLILTNVLILVWAWRKKLWSIISLTLWMDFMVWVMVQGMKLIAVGPWSLRPTGSPGGFPSGHATHAFAMAFLLTLFFPRFRWLWYGCAASISWSRVEIDAHSGVQVTAGIILGVGIVCILAGEWYQHAEAAFFRQTAHNPSAVSPARQSYAVE